MSRASLHSALAAHKQSASSPQSASPGSDGDSISKPELLKLLTEGPTALSESAAGSIAEGIFASQADRRPADRRVSFEALVSYLLPATRLARFDELYETEIAAMRKQFGNMDGGWGAINFTKLDVAVQTVPGLHPDGKLRPDDRDAIMEQIRLLPGGRVDLQTLFEMIREQQRKQWTPKQPPHEDDTDDPPPLLTSAQLTKLLASFDQAGTGQLLLEKAEAILDLYRCPSDELGIELAAALETATTTVVEPPVFIQPEIQRKMVDYKKLVSALTQKPAAGSQVPVQVRR